MGQKSLEWKSNRNTYLLPWKVCLFNQFIVQCLFLAVIAKLDEKFVFFFQKSAVKELNDCLPCSRKHTYGLFPFFVFSMCFLGQVLQRFYKQVHFLRARESLKNLCYPCINLALLWKSIELGLGCVKKRWKERGVQLKKWRGSKNACSANARNSVSCSCCYPVGFSFAFCTSAAKLFCEQCFSGIRTNVDVFHVDFLGGG